MDELRERVTPLRSLNASQGGSSPSWVFASLRPSTLLCFPPGWFVLGPSPGVCVHTLAKMDLKAKVSGRSKIHYGLELSSNFESKEPFWAGGVVAQSLSHVQLLKTHGLQQARLLYPSPSPRLCSNPCPLSRWCHPIISSSVILFSSCLQSFPASGSFLMSQLFA